jgi:class 3 adenylate cyclase
MTIWFGIYNNQMRNKVREKVNELNNEKMKTDMLLYQMLPKSIAIQLKYGRAIMRKNYDSATVFFSDIKGFAVLSLNSSPLQVSKHYI